MKNVDTDEMVMVLQQYNGYIKNVCRRFYIAGGTRDDLFQEGVIGLLQACKNYKGQSLLESKFDAFAKLCIKRQIIDAVKKTQTQKNRALNNSVPLVSSDENGDEVSRLDIIVDRTTICDPLEIFLDKEKFNEKMEICSKELNEFEKQVLNLYLSGEKQAEIAKILGKPKKSIDNTLQRIKAKLK